MKEVLTMKGAIVINLGEPLRFKFQLISLRGHFGTVVIDALSWSVMDIIERFTWDINRLRMFTQIIMDMKNANSELS